MKRTSDTILQAMTFMAENNGEAIEIINNCTVRLEAPDFLGAGVSCMVQKDGHLRERALVATSKQNLLRLAGTDERPEFTDYEIKALLRDFVDKVVICYGHDLKTSIDHLAVVEPDWNHDLLLLVSYEPKFVTYVKAWGIYAGIGSIREHRDYYLGNFSLPLSYVQAGFGDDTDDGMLQYRITARRSVDQDKAAAMQPRELVLQDVCLVDADPENTMSNGDEGGPLFAIFNDEESEPEVFLVGVGSGPNFEPDPLPEGTPIVNNAITYTRPLIERTFLELDHSS